MSINVNQLKNLVIIPTLKILNLYSEADVNLLLGTCAQESQMGTFLHQITGPALGIYQMEPFTHNDLWATFLNNPKHHFLATTIMNKISCQEEDALVYNLRYATAMTRVFYLRVPEAIPPANDINKLATYWKKYYNTEKGSGRVEEFIANYHKFVV